MEEAARTCARAIALFPDSPEPYAVLGYANQLQGRMTKAQTLYERATDLSTTEFYPYQELVRLYETKGQFDKAEALLKKEIKINQPHNDDNDTPDKALVDFYARRGLTDKINQAYNETISRRTPSESIEEIETVLMQNRTGAVEPVLSVTAFNYRQIRDAILARGMAMIAMQYPRNDVRDLMSILEHSPRVVFIDNEKNFENALAHGRYDDYFVDRFGGDWGHATEAGNRLIAQNLVPHVLGVRRGIH